MHQLDHRPASSQSQQIFGSKIQPTLTIRRWGQCTTHRSLCMQDQVRRSRKLSSSLTFQQVSSLTTHCKVADSQSNVTVGDVVGTVWSNAGPEIQVRTTEILEPSHFKRSSTATSAHLRRKRRMWLHEAHLLLLCCRVEASRASRVRLRVDTFTSNLSVHVGFRDMRILIML